MVQPLQGTYVRTDLHCFAFMWLLYFLNGPTNVRFTEQRIHDQQIFRELENLDRET